MEHGFILQPTHRVRDGRAVVQLWGRLASGPGFLVEEMRFRPYFFVPATDRACVPGDADASYLVQKLEGADGISDDPMPPPAGGLDAEKIERVRSWIDNMQ